MLHLAPAAVDLSRAVAGNRAPLSRLMPRLASVGVRAVSASCSPTGCSNWAWPTPWIRDLARRRRADHAQLGRSRNPARTGTSLAVQGVSAALSQAGALLLRHWWPLTFVGCLFSRVKFRHDPLRDRRAYAPAHRR
ncbi:hypothetical protein E3T56_05505 [Cryobacterium psychrotolerans]|nr:hypothetical protein E3T56_05505 [Cryobacterium psychrotolerans]